MSIEIDGETVVDEAGCLAALADTWAAAAALEDPWHAWILASLLQPLVRSAFDGVRVH